MTNTECNYFPPEKYDFIPLKGVNGYMVIKKHRKEEAEK